MGKELERKWFLKDCYDIKKLKLGKPSIIKDYYFNETTRLRNKDGKWYITVKSLGTFDRDEFEFKLNKKEINFLPSPMLEKRRYKIKHEGQIFELNNFVNLGFELNLIEFEYPNQDFYVDIPEWCGVEVTNNKNFYGYELYKIMKANIDRGFKFRDNSLLPPDKN